MKKRLDKGRALFYTRDSGGEHEMTPAAYVGWACRKAEEFNLTFDGIPERIDIMIREGRSTDGDLFIDYGVKGNVLSRPGLNALLDEALKDPNVTHVCIPRRDRLARPNNPEDGLKLENVLRRNGITLVFMDRLCPPLGKGQRRDIADLIVTVIDYHKSKEERRLLALKIIPAQIRLAKLGYSTGGRPPYGFRRWLVREDGTPVRQLADGESIRMAGHHVVWLPGPEEELEVIRRILAMLETMPAAQVAAILTREGVPPPDFGRWRKDHGIKHPTSGVWHQTTIISIARNPLLRALVSYGRRSMGDELRFTTEGPRELEEDDFRSDGKAKVVNNPESARIVVPAKFDPVADPARHDKLLATLDARAGTQRGKPRSQDPAKNPLGCRVFDMSCGWPMYRVPCSKSFRYRCGFYQQSHGAKCDHNQVDGPTAVRFLLGCLRQKLFSSNLLTKLEKRLREIAEREIASCESNNDLANKQAALADIQGKLGKVKQNLAMAETPEQYKAVATVFDDLQRQRTCLESEIAALQRTATSGSVNIKAEVAAALEMAKRLTDLAADAENFAAIGDVFRQVNVRLFLRFGKEQAGKRVLNKLVSGVVTFGAAPPPITIYEGPTARKMIKGPATALVAGPGDPGSPGSPKPVGPGGKGESLGNVSRGDWIRTSDLLNPIQAAQCAKPYENRGFAEPPAAVCTPVCTSNTKTDHGNTLEALAAALVGLSPANRAELAAMLLSGQGTASEGEGG